MKFKSKKGLIPIFILVFLTISITSKAQNLDLIITHVGDSIACRIDSVTDLSIYFEMKYNYNWGPAELEKDEYSEYQIKAINQDNVIYKPGTSFIIDYKSESKPRVSDVYVPPKYQKEPIYDQDNGEVIAAPPKQELNKNAIYGNVGTLIFYSTFTINYERLIFGADPSVPVALFARIGYGGFYVTDTYSEFTGNFGLISAVLITGKNAGHFEGSLGYMFSNEAFNSSFQFSGAFRYQAPGKGLMYKVGGGFPEIIFFGMGLSF